MTQIDTIPFEDLRRLYDRTCGIDIRQCLDEEYLDNIVPLAHCKSCDLEFYPSILRGNEKLYEVFRKLDVYYMSEKWEFDRALEDIDSRQSILEVGSGPGHFLAKVVQAFNGKRIVGLELNQAATQKNPSRNLPIVAKTLEQIASEQPECFDAVCAFQVIEHVSNPSSFIDSAFRCLRSGGVLVMSVPNREGFAKFVVNDFGNMPPHHLTRWNIDVMKNVAKLYGARITRVLEEPVAEYHREWYRTTLTVQTLSKLLRRRWQKVECGLAYQMILSASARLQKIWPATSWDYERSSGHTLYTVFEKAK